VDHFAIEKTDRGGAETRVPKAEDCGNAAERAKKGSTLEYCWGAVNVASKGLG